MLKNGSSVHTTLNTLLLSKTPNLQELQLIYLLSRSFNHGEAETAETQTSVNQKVFFKRVIAQNYVVYDTFFS